MTTRTRTTRRILRDGTEHFRTVEVRPVAPRECAWCRSTDRVQAVGISDYLGRPGWIVMTCPECLGKTFAEGRIGSTQAWASYPGEQNADQT